MKLQTFKNKLQTLQAPAQAQKNPKQNNWGSGRGGRPWRRLKAKIHLRDEWTCQCCGTVTKDLELDHIVNVARGGTDDESNLQSLCVPCHKKKTQQESRQ
ncbi:HNH endonuclease [Acinetobacter baumannii]|uniref:HNH endonuclease n=1 Tax=Acinetobacter baumannii TaxID=470 RepID=UPI0019CFF10D|nr:HNH endonuclease [Acinetobacter baumannii]